MEKDKLLARLENDIKWREELIQTEKDKVRKSSFEAELYILLVYKSNIEVGLFD